VQEDGKSVDIPIREGDIFLLPGKVPHSPRREANSVGLVIEKVRSAGMKDGLQWYCPECNNKLYEEYFDMTDIVNQMQPVFEKFYQSEDLRTCKACGHVLPVPGKPA
jgi:3-hydroxyanthranilate 3,4-dioxygenase